MLGIYENDVRESINNGAWLSSVKDCNFSSERSRLICEAGRWCESYASDILIDFESVKAYLERLASGEESEGREFWFGSCGSVIDLFSLPYNHKPEVAKGVMQEECAALLTDFFKKLRKK